MFSVNGNRWHLIRWMEEGKKEGRMGPQSSTLPIFQSSCLPIFLSSTLPIFPSYFKITILRIDDMSSVSNW